MRRSLFSRILAALIAPALLSLALPHAARAQTMPSYTFRGTGFGHGIGLSQYGARGAALAGKDYRWIIGHYFTGTSIVRSSAIEAKVNIDCAYRDATYPGRPYWTIKSVGSALRVWRAKSTDPTLELDADTWYVFSFDGKNVLVKTTGGATVGSFDDDVWVAPVSGSPGLLEVREKSTSTDGAYHPLDANGWPTNGFTNVRYRGRILVQRKPGARVAAINQLPIDQYLYGVLPREMPASWGDKTPEALKAQAVAARSYAYADVAAGAVLKCTTYSQVYKGHSRMSQGTLVMHEDSRTNGAVDATALEVAKYGSSVIKAYFFSHSGGHTANNEDVWVSGTPLPWARGVPDSFEYLASPPYAPWPSYKQVTLTGLQLADKLRGLPGVPASPAWVAGVIFDRAPSGHVRYVTFRFSNGGSARLTGDTVRSKLGLLSTVFYTSGFPIERIAGSNRYETAAAISAAAYPVSAPAVVLASGEGFADALTGSAVAGAADGPLLLTSNANLSAATSAELARLKPRVVYLMGSERTLSAAVEDAVRRLLPDSVVIRLGGADRYETARLAAEEVRRLAGTVTVILASGTSWPDAAAASALAFARAYPILLSAPTALSSDAADYLTQAKPSHVLIVGGLPTLAQDIDQQVEAITAQKPIRLAGSDRYETAAEIARYCVQKEAFATDQVYVATGVVYPDSLAGGTLAGARRTPLLLTHTDACRAGTAAFLREYKSTLTSITLFGSTGAISEAGLKSIDDVMMQ